MGENQVLMTLKKEEVKKNQQVTLDNPSFSLPIGGAVPNKAIPCPSYMQRD